MSVSVALLVVGFVAYVALGVFDGRRQARYDEYARAARQAGELLRPLGFVLSKAESRPWRVEWQHPDGRYAVVDESKV